MVSDFFMKISLITNYETTRNEGKYTSMDSWYGIFFTGNFGIK